MGSDTAPDGRKESSGNLDIESVICGNCDEDRRTTLKKTAELWVVDYLDGEVLLI